MNLLSSLKQTQTKRAQQPVPGAGANLTKMLAAKSGKAGAVSGPAASSVQEQQALADFNAQATQQQQAAQIDVAGQQQQLDQVNQRAGQEMQRLTQQEEDLEQRYNQGVEKIEQGLERLRKDIDSKEGQQAIQQLVFARRLADDKYTTALAREGQRRRLEDRQQFQLEAAKSVFGRTMDLFENQESFNRLITADERAFNAELAKMDLDFANQLIADNREAANRQAKIQSYGNLASAFVQAGSTAYTTTNAQGKETNASFFGRLANDQPITSTTAPEPVSSSPYGRYNDGVIDPDIGRLS